MCCPTDSRKLDNEGETVLMWAARHGRTGTVADLVAKGADPNAKDNDGWTALMSAARNGHSGTVAELVAKGADPNAKNKVSDTSRYCSALRINVSSLRP